MITVRESSYDEFITWYLRRENRKNSHDENWGIPDSDIERLQKMKSCHYGKTHDWFEHANWGIVRMQTLDDLERLICLDSEWTKETKLTVHTNEKGYRLLKKYVLNAKKCHYFEQDENVSDYNRRMKKYHDFEKRWPNFVNEERVTIITPTGNEKNRNPEGSFYLHDGIGRLLAYLYLIYYGGRSLSEVEAFCADKKVKKIEI